MKKRIVLTCIVLLLSQSLLAQQPVPSVNWDSLKFLVGKWAVEVSAESGQQGSGSCSFEAGLQGKVLVRKNHAEYPATKDWTAIVHDDLTVIYPDRPTGLLRAFYTDNDGNVINYTVSVSSDGKSAVFLGDAVPAAPRFRLTYALTERDRMTFTFELALPGKAEQFQKLIVGSMKGSVDLNGSAK